MTSDVGDSRMVELTELEKALEAKVEFRENRRIAYRRKKSKNIFKHWWYFGHFKKEERWEDAPCDKVRYHFFKKGIRQIEKNGLEIWRDWIDYGGTLDEPFPMRCKLFQKERFSFRHPFRRRYMYTFPWDCGDINEYLIVKMTIVGMTLFRHGHCLCDREIAHRIWEVREMLIKAYYNSEWSVDGDPMEQLKEVYSIIGKEHLNWWD